MISKVENISEEQLNKIRVLVGEAFVTNELFHNWGTTAERREDVMKYMAIYVDYVYHAGELYANEDLTGFIGLEDSENAHKFLQVKMLLRMLTGIRFSRLKSLVDFANTYDGKMAPLPVYLDDEGIVASDVELIKNGILVGYMNDRETAKHFGMEAKGNARGWGFADEPIIRMRNTCVLPGKNTVEENSIHFGVPEVVIYGTQKNL